MAQGGEAYHETAIPSGQSMALAKEVITAIEKYWYSTPCGGSRIDWGRRDDGSRQTLGAG